MPSIFEGIKFESPLEVQARLHEEQLSAMRQMPDMQAFGFALGSSLSRALSRFRTGERGDGFMHRMRTGVSDPRIAEAQEAQEVMSAVQSVAQAQVESGEDPTIARISAMKRAASEFQARGRSDLAAQLQAQALTLQAQFEVHQAELAKLRADTRVANANANRLENPEPAEPKDELIRMQDERDRLNAILQEQNLSGPAAQVIAQRIDETNQRINKIISITGRTEHDVAASKPTITALEKSLMDTQPQLDLINETIANMNPEFFTLQGRFKGSVLRIKDIVSSRSLTDEEKTELVQRTQLVQSMSEGLNSYIKAITGAQMAVAEAERLRRDVPDPDNDGPTVLQAKAQRWARRLPAIQARTRAALAAGDVTIINTPLEQWMQPDDDAEAVFREAEAILGR